jgi:hypothetical protein
MSTADTTTNITVCHKGFRTLNADKNSGMTAPNVNQMETRSVVIISTITVMTIIDNHIQKVVLILFSPLILLCYQKD